MNKKAHFHCEFEKMNFLSSFVTNQQKRLFFCAAPYESLQFIKKQAFLLEKEFVDS